MRKTVTGPGGGDRPTHSPSHSLVLCFSVSVRKGLPLCTRQKEGKPRFMSPRSRGKQEVHCPGTLRGSNAEWRSWESKLRKDSEDVGTSIIEKLFPAGRGRRRKW